MSHDPRDHEHPVAAKGKPSPPEVIGESLLFVSVHRMGDGKIRFEWRVGPPEGTPGLTDNEIVALSGALNRIGLSLVKMKVQAAIEEFEREARGNGQPNPEPLDEGSTAEPKTSKTSKTSKSSTVDVSMYG